VKTSDIQTWEDEGGAAPVPCAAVAAPKKGNSVPGRPRGQVIPIDRRKTIRLSRLEAERAMNIRPLYDRIVVKRIEEQETTRNGIVIPDSAKEKPQQGEAMAVGRGKRLDKGELAAVDVKVGDRVLFAKYSGNETKLEGTEYIIMREDDVLGVLESGKETT
jgi:chaperonin GroES